MYYRKREEEWDSVSQKGKRDEAREREMADHKILYHEKECRFHKLGGPDKILITE